MAFLYLPINIAVITQLSLANQIAVLTHDISQNVIQGNASWLLQH